MVWCISSIWWVSPLCLVYCSLWELDNKLENFGNVLWNNPNFEKRKSNFSFIYLSIIVPWRIGEMIYWISLQVFIDSIRYHREIIKHSGGSDEIWMFVPWDKSRKNGFEHQNFKSIISNCPIKCWYLTNLPTPTLIKNMFQVLILMNTLYLPREK